MKILVTGAARKGISSDLRLGYQFIYPGCGCGGSCFPKDVQALERTAAEIGYDAQLLKAVEAVNRRQKILLGKLARHLGGESRLQGRTIAVWGLAFRPNTNDMREAPSRILPEALWKAGAKVQAFDPVAADEARRLYGEWSDLSLAPNNYSALEGGRRAGHLHGMAAVPGARLGRDGEAAGVQGDRRWAKPVCAGEAAGSGWAYLAIGRGGLVPPGVQ